MQIFRNKQFYYQVPSNNSVFLIELELILIYNVINTMFILLVYYLSIIKDCTVSFDTIMLVIVTPYSI
jgi:hypothetical protein